MASRDSLPLGNQSSGPLISRTEAMKNLKIFLTIFLALVCSSKEVKSIQAYGEANAQQTTMLYIYGGEDGDEYLGKLNASEYDSESIWNEYGKYGSKYNSQSIWNKYGTYGSEYSQYSPFNAYASHPPVLRDRNGRFYGYFTSNKYKSKRANYDLVDIICEHYESIREDVGDWYDKIF